MVFLIKYHDFLNEIKKMEKKQKRRNGMICVSNI